MKMCSFTRLICAIDIPDISLRLSVPRNDTALTSQCI